MPTWSSAARVCSSAVSTVSCLLFLYQSDSVPFDIVKSVTCEYVFGLEPTMSALTAALIASSLVSSGAHFGLPPENSRLASGR
jgi:hypothetical protein